jgi:hypothetical protein
MSPRKFSNSHVQGVESKLTICILGGVMVSVPTVHRFKLSRGDGFLRVIKMRSTPSFGGEVKLSAPCCKILKYVKEFYKYERNGL